MEMKTPGGILRRITTTTTHQALGSEWLWYHHHLKPSLARDFKHVRHYQPFLF